MDFIPYGRQSVDEQDIASVVAVMRGDFLTCGPQVAAFEEEFAATVGSNHAVAVCNATAALHLAMVVAKVGPGHRVVTSPNTFLASANCAAYVGAIPDFSDIDTVSYNLDPAALASTWKDDTKAVIAVDYAGPSADMPGIARIARERGAVVIEDACHAVGGGFLNDSKVWKQGGHPWADMTVFSFHPVKTMTTGEGGMLVTNDPEYAYLARKFRSHGIERTPDRFLNFGASGDPMFEIGPWAYEMQCLGFNYRITDLQCALGRNQLRRLPEFVRRRRALVSLYNAGLSGIPWLKTPGLLRSEDAEHTSWHLYTVQIDFSYLGRSRSEIMDILRRQGIGTQVLYIPVHLQPWYRTAYGYAAGKCPNAESFYLRALSLPLYPALSDQDVQRVIRSLRSLDSLK